MAPEGGDEVKRVLVDAAWRAIDAYILFGTRIERRLKKRFGKKPQPEAVPMHRDGQPFYTQRIEGDGVITWEAKS